VVSPAQARDLLAALRGLSGRRRHLEAFYACLYYAALRPSEAVMLRDSNPHLPKTGWGRIVLAATASRAGTAWTDHGTARQERGLKHRADHESRTIPSRPISSGCCAPTSSGTAPPRTGSSRPPGAASSRTRHMAKCGPKPASKPYPGPAPVAARPTPLRPAARCSIAVAELRGTGDRIACAAGFRTGAKASLAGSWRAGQLGAVSRPGSGRVSYAEMVRSTRGTRAVGRRSSPRPGAVRSGRP
jgi:hypothetical protein